MMNRNVLKTIACLTMLIDHIGFLLLPGVAWLRWIGRLSMPLFAFFIAEGCRYTSNKLRYFLRIFLLGVGCQAVYIAEQALTGRVYSYYFNILLTFSFSMLICFSYLFWESKQCNHPPLISKLAGTPFFLTVFLAIGFCALCQYIEAETYYEFTIDYGLAGILLPLAAVLSRDRSRQFLYFSFAIVLFCVVSCTKTPYVWFALLDIPLLALYNGKKGKPIFKYGFYLFYPAHLAVLYLIQAIF